MSVLPYYMARRRSLASAGEGEPVVQAGSFDGASAMTIGPDRPVNLLHGAAQITVMARVWIAEGSSGLRMVLATQIGTGSPAAAGLDLAINASGQILAAGRSSTSDSYQSIAGATAVTEGEWHTIFAVLDFANDTIDVYLDDSATADNASSSVTFGASTLTAGTTFNGLDRIGASIASTADNFFAGELRDLAIFRRALTSTERANIHGGDRPDQIGGVKPVIYFPMDAATDAPGRFAHSRIGGIVGVPTGTLPTSTVADPTMDAHAAKPTEARFGPLRAMRLRAADASSFGSGNAISEVEMRGIGDTAFQSTGTAQPTYQVVSTRPVMRFDGVDDHFVVRHGKLQADRGITIIALANVTSGFRICSITSGGNELSNSSVMFSAEGGLAVRSTNVSASAYSDYTMGSSGAAIFSGRYTGNAVKNWLNGVARNGTVSNGTELNDGSFIPTYKPTTLLDNHIRIGRRISSGTSGITNMDLYDLMIVQGALTDEEIQYLEGVMAWENDFTSLLPADHPWKSTQPDVSSTISYPWGNDVVARSPDPASKYVGASTIVRHNGSIFVGHDFFGNETNRTRLYVRNAENDWRGVAELQNFFWATFWEHTDGHLYGIGTDRQWGNLVIKKSTDHGVTWSSTTLSSATGPLAAAGATTTAPNYHRASGQPPLYHDGHMFFAYQNMSPSVSYAANFMAGVLYIDATADLMDETQWSAPSELASGSTGFSNRYDGATPGFEEGNIVLQGSTLYNVMRFSGSSTPDKAVFLELGWDGATLTMPTWDSGDIKDFPGGNVKFQMTLEGSTYYAITNDNTAVGDAIGGHSQDQRNNVTLLTGTSLSTPDFTVSQTLVAKADLITASGLSEIQSVQYHGVQYASFEIDGSTMHVGYRIGWSGAKDRHDSNFIGYGTVALP